ncbi:MAG: branched-chain amino acid ABC transporter permease [Syntrophobacterales bacterium]|nr:branched-chain amino acid ABC transporter permease [Syntrophobacterales bacterium]
MNINRPCGTFDRNYFQAKELYRTPMRKVLLVLFIIAMYAFPFLIGDYGISILTPICAFVIGMLGLQIITGYSGQISIGHAAFMGIGMYTVAILQKYFGFSFWLALPFSGLVAMAVGIVFGIPALRMKGLYLAFATLAAHFVIVYVISNWRSVTNGTDGMYMSRPGMLFGIDFMEDRNYYFLALTVTVIMTYLATNLARTKLGRSLVAVRDNDIAAELMGINVGSTKILAFGIGCFFAGVSGAVGGAYYEYVNVEWFGLDDSIWYLGFLVVGGFGSIFGAIAGAVVWKVMDELSTLVTPLADSLLGGAAFYASAAFSLLFYSLIIIIFLVFEPRGISHRWEMIKRSYRLHPFPY